MVERKLTKSELTRNAIVTDLVGSLKAGLPPWRQPWSPGKPAGRPCNFRTLRPYGGVNSLLLTGRSARKGYRSNHWGTVASWKKALDVVPRVGENPAVAVFYGTLRRGRGYFRQYLLYNAEQIEVADERAAVRMAKHLAPSRLGEPNFAPAELLLANSGVTFRHGGDRACYLFEADVVLLPHRSDFETLADWYETAFHEVVHFCRRADRAGASSGSYPFEELVAEIGSCFLLAELGVPLAEQMIEKSQSYVWEWLQTINGEPRFIFDAARQAGKVVDYLLARQVNLLSRAS